MTTHQTVQKALVRTEHDSPLGRHAFVPLTSVNQGFEDRGRRAIELLSKLIAGHSAGTVTVSPSLTVRESTSLASGS